MSPEDKLAKGFPLSAEDIKALLKDPHSWLSQLYAECKREALIDELTFIYYIEAIIRETILSASYERKFEAVVAARSSREVTSSLDVNLSDIQTISSALSNELIRLLTQTIEAMNEAQLENYHHQIITNYNNQISAQLGPSITLALTMNGTAKNLTLKVPQLSSKGTPSAADILSHHPYLADEMTDEAAQETFSLQAAKAATGYLATLNKAREILETNRESLMKIGMNIDQINLTPALVKKIDTAVSACQNNNKQLLEQLFQTNKCALSQQYQPTPRRALR